MSDGASESAASAASPPMPRVRRRSTTPAAAVAPIATATVASWKGSCACGSARLTSGMTAIASPRRTTPRTPAIRPSAAAHARLGARRRRRCCRRRRGRPRPSGRARARAARCAGPSRPGAACRRALSAIEQLLGHVAVAARGEPEVGRRDPLVARVHERRGLVEVHLALGEEAVGHALREGGAEGARVGEGRQHGRHHARLGVLARDPAAQRVHERRVGRRGVADHLLGELELVAVAVPRTSSMRARTSASSMPGGVRQSTASRAREGMTLIFSEAKMRVGASVTPSIGSTMIARMGSRSRSASSDGRRIAVEREGRARPAARRGVSVTS